MLLIVFAQMKAGNKSGNQLNKFSQIIYFLYQAKKLLKKITNNIMIFKKLQNRIDTVFMNSENSKRFSLLDLSDKVNLIRMKNMLLYQI